MLPMTAPIGRDRFRRRGQTGLSAVELMVVLVILALLAVATYPSLSNILEVLASKGAAEQTVAAMRLGRQYAISQARNFCIQFGPGSSAPFTEYTIMQADTADPPACVSGTGVEGHVAKTIGPRDERLAAGDQAVIFDAIGNRVVPTGTSNSVWTVKTNPDVCTSTITVTPYGGVRVAGC